MPLRIMRMRLLFLLTLCSLFVLFTQTEARHLHRRVFVKKEADAGNEGGNGVEVGEEVEEEEEEVGEEEEELEEEEGQEEEEEIEEEGEEEEEEVKEEVEEEKAIEQDYDNGGSKHHAGAVGAVDKHGHGNEGAEYEVPGERAFEGPINVVETGVDGRNEEEDARNYDDYEDEDANYYKIDKKSWDTFCEKMKSYWQNVGEGIKDEWCKLRSMFSNL